MRGHDVSDRTFKVLTTSSWLVEEMKRQLPPNCELIVSESRREEDLLSLVGEVDVLVGVRATRTVIEQAHKESRILLTEDRDFGWLVFVSRRKSAGVVLLRFPGNARRTLGNTVLKVVQEEAARLPGSFTVIQPGQVRISEQL